MSVRREAVLRVVLELLADNDAEVVPALLVAERLGIDTENEEQLANLFTVLGTLGPHGIRFEEVAGGNGVIFREL